MSLIKIVAAMILSVACMPALATTYYISPSGSDGNAGTSSSSPWLTPNHALHCGDTVTAAAGTYSSSNFQNGDWGTVSCPAGNNVAWLQCATFDTCKLSSTTSDAMWVDKSFWGIQGWEASTSSTHTGACFHAGPSGSTSIHHIIFANNVANGCSGGGFNAYAKPGSSTASVDYIVYVGNVAYNTSGGSGACYSAFNIFEPIASDTAPGTHMYVAGNFAYNNVDGNPCAGTAPTDGEGVNFDTWDFSQGSGPAYTQQGVIQNNILVNNGGRAIEVELNSAGSSSAPIYLKYNTGYGDMTDLNQTFCTGNGEVSLYKAFTVTATNNLMATRGATGCGGQAIYAFSVSTSNSSDTVNTNWLAGTSGNNTYLFNSGSFAYGSGNVLGTSPAFASTTIPGAPSCSGTTNVPNCMATLIANFKPTNGSATAYGYQTPSSTSVVDALFPQWLCNVNLPSGLVTPGCGNIFNVNNAMSASTISSIAATAASSTGNTVQFAGGTYALSGTLNLPCTNGVIYQGIAITEPNISNVPAVLLTGPNASSYSITVPSNGTGNTSYTSGCQFKNLGFSGQHGGIFVNYPASGINIQYNYFTLNDGAYAGGAGPNANQNIHLDGACPSSGSGNLCGASLGVSWIQIDSNVFYNQCPTIRNNNGVDSQAYCSAVFTFGYNNQEKITNNIVNLIEEGFKWQEVYYQITNVMNNIDVENNNISGNSRIAIETQQNSNGNAIFSHNSHYQPYNPGFNTFGDSVPINQASPAAVLNDNVYIGNVPVTIDGSGAHYGIGMEVWGAGMNGQYNVLQGGNSAGGCAGAANGFCSSWQITMGGNNSGQSWTNNYFSGAEVWNGSSTNLGKAFSIEDGASLGNATLSPNTVAQTSTTLATATPVISPNGGSYAGPVTVTISDSDSAHRNVTIFYTTDGSTPAPFVIGGSAGTSQVYTGPFVVPLGTTVNAIAQWGQGANQGISFPSFGWVPSSVTAQTYSSGGTVTLQSVTVAGVGGATVEVGSTLQLSATCHYSDGSTTPCNTLDTHGNVVTAWSASNGNLTISSSGLATGVSIGTTNVTATVTGGLVSTPALAVTVSASPLTLSSVSLATTGGVSSLATMQTNQLISTCHYNDGSSTACNTVDSHGNGVSTFSSSAPASATVNSSGLVSGVAAGSTNLTASVIPAPAMLGSNVFTTTGFTSAGYINYNYGVTGTAPGTYTPGTCQIYMPAMSWTAGQFIDCILTPATSPTTQASSAFCSNRFTTTGSSWPGGFISISMASCPGLPPDTAFWLGNQTNIPGTPGQGFNNCGGGCNGVVPTQGSGTYGYWYVANPTMGNYTGMTTALLAGGALQVSEYLTLTTNPITSANLPLTIVAAPPTLLSAYLTASGSSLVVPNTLQMAAKCHYSSGADQDCTVADIYGDAVSQWNTSDATKATIGAIGSASPGLVTAVAAGTTSITARIAGTGPTSAAYPITITNAPVTLTGISLATAGGVTGLFVGSTNQLKATCTYSDGSSDDCTTTDTHGNLAHSYVSATPAHATVNATSGLVTGVAPGTTTFTAVAGSFTSSPLPLAVFPVLSGIYTITISGPVKFSGTVRF